MITHLFDSSAVLAGLLDEPGSERVRALLDDPALSVALSVGVSILTLYEVYTAVLHRTGSHEAASTTVSDLREVVGEIVPVNDAVLAEAIGLRRASKARLALADCLIAATAVLRGVPLVHRDPHFAELPMGKPAQESLPAKA